MSGVADLLSKQKGIGSSTANDAEKRLDQREMQFAALKYDISTAKPLKEIVLCEIRNGTDPKWIVVKYGHLGVTLERVQAAKAAIDKQRETKNGNDLHRRHSREGDQAEEHGQRKDDALGTDGA